MGLVISAPLPLRYNMVCVLYHLPEGRDNSCCWMVFELSTAVYSLRLPFLVDIHSGRLGSCKKKCWASISQIISTCLQSNLHLPSPVEGWGRVGGGGGGWGAGMFKQLFLDSGTTQAGWRKMSETKMWNDNTGPQ